MSNLSQQQKNDIIGKEIMGWHPDFAKCHWWDPVSNTLPRPRTGVTAFDPCNSLDDCFLVEEKMRRGSLWMPYVHSLYEELAAFQSRIIDQNYSLIHATPEQKVTAMLKALDIS